MLSVPAFVSQDVYTEKVGQGVSTLIDDLRRLLLGMEDFKPEDAWAITKMVQLATSSRKKRQQIDHGTRKSMLTQWDWWKTNYVDDPTERSRLIPLGPTRKLLEVIEKDELMQRQSPSELVSAARRAQNHVLINRYKSESRRAHQIALTNAATTTRMLQSTTANKFLALEMNRMTTGAVLSRASMGESRETLRATLSSLSVLDLVPENSAAHRLPRSPSPYFERELASTRKKQHEIRMLYLGKSSQSAPIETGLGRKAISLPVSSAVSVYTPDLDSTSAKSFPMTMQSLTTSYPVMEAKCNSTLWKNPATHPIDNLPHVDAK